jgi:hypothetical protein
VIKKQDWPIPIEVLQEVEKLLEREWKKAKTLTSQKRIAELGVWFIVGFCTGIRGEENLIVELAGTANSLKFLDDGKMPNFAVVVLGITKGTRLSGAKFGIPCVAVTEGTNLEP